MQCSQERRKRIVKALPKTEDYSTRYISFNPTPETPSTHFDPSLAGRELFNPTMLCYNLTQTVTRKRCWNGVESGVYNSNLLVIFLSSYYSSINIICNLLPKLKILLV